MKEKVLFICTHNSARSQIAEAFLRYFKGEKYEVYSAGTEPSVVNPYAIRVMAELGISMKNHFSKGVERFLNMEIDYVVTVCDHAKEVCPYFPGGKKYIHKSFEDPSASSGREEDILQKFREVRDRIREWIIREW